MPRKKRAKAKRQVAKGWPRIWLREGRLGVTLGDPRVWETEEGVRVQRAVAETQALEAMWEASGE